MLERFERWMGRHGRLYAHAGEKQRRLEVYRRNVELVEQFNSMNNGGYKLADNKFADLTNEEFRAKMLGFGPHSRTGHTTTAPSTMACGANQIKNGKMVSLSEQELVDCDTEAVGCAGGYMSWAFEFVMKNRGLTTEGNYPYLGMNGNCQTPKLNESAVTISGYRNFLAG
nr:unnamed protein product [Digitaria exilis]